ncbi:unnamed protein product [Oppiella nova]|uniref:Uncharacterized protein n=1 Tax=Oppiella nova TaxID=334625 RepID=A0A7R9LVY4_9ACAR|nr:unnamed protein product [Oppiella nova]CAG2167519.1 unnamed protein product [Oppiella nova]
MTETPGATDVIGDKLINDKAKPTPTNKISIGKIGGTFKLGLKVTYTRVKDDTKPFTPLFTIENLDLNDPCVDDEHKPIDCNNKTPQSKTGKQLGDSFKCKCKSEDFYWEHTVTNKSVVMGCFQSPKCLTYECDTNQQCALDVGGKPHCVPADGYYQRDETSPIVKIDACDLTLLIRVM